MKKLISFILVLAVCLSVLSLTVNAAKEAGFSLTPKTTYSGTWGNLSWTLDGDGTLVIRGSGPMNDFDFFSDEAWRAYEDSVQSIVIRNGVTTICDYAFLDFYSLISVDIANSVVSIGESAFEGCYLLNSLALGSGVATIDNYAFKFCDSLADINLPDSLLFIGEEAFAACGYLTAITIPGGVATIGPSAFLDCYSLTNIKVNSANTSYCDIDGVLFSKDKTILIQHPKGKTNTSYIVPDSVTTIGDNAFIECGSLKSITIPSGVTTIGNYSFGNCASLTSLAIPNSIVTVGTGAFSGCSSLTSVNIPDSITAISDYMFCNSDSLVSVTIPDSVTYIGNRAFGYCPAITNITVPNSVGHIGKEAFLGCFALKDVAIGNGVAAIGEEAFAVCRSLTSVIIPGSVSVIGEAAFRSCEVLENVIISDGVVSIGAEAFVDCVSLTNITIPKSVANIGSNAFYECASLVNINVNSENVSYCDVDGVLFNKDKTILIQYTNGKTSASYTVPNGVVSIDNYAFNSSVSLIDVTIPVSVATIGNYAFRNCISLETVNYGGSEMQWNKIEMGTLNESLLAANIVYACVSDVIQSGTWGNLLWEIDNNHVLTIEGVGAMNGFDLSSTAAWRAYGHQIYFVIIGNGITTIGDYAFCGAWLTGVKLPDSITTIGKFAFDSSDLMNITIPNSVTTIGDSAFVYTDLTSITIPDSVTSIGKQAFYYNHKLKSVIISDGVVSIGEEAFSYCPSLTSIKVSTDNTAYSDLDGVLFNKDKTILVQYPWGKTSTSYVIPDSVTTVGSYAFSWCKTLKSVVISEGVTVIEKGAFYHCSGLESLEFSSSVTTISSYAFYMCSSLYALVLGSGVEIIEAHAFKECTSLRHVVFPKTVKSIGDYAFSECSSLEYAYYIGTEETWDGVSIGTNNGPLKNAEMYYGESVHYDDIPMSTDKVLPRYPIYDESSYAKTLEQWVLKSEYVSAFKAYLDLGYTYKDMLYFTIDTPVLGNDGEAYSVKSDVCIKDLMSYIIFSKEVEKYMVSTIAEVRRLMTEGKHEKAYKYYLDAISAFHQQYINFQSKLNGVDSFNQTLDALLSAKAAIAITKTSPLKHVVSYIENFKKATVFSSPADYDSIDYYIRSFGDASKLNPYYKDKLSELSSIIKDSKQLYTIHAKGTLGVSDKVVDISFDDLAYFADVYALECADEVKLAEDIWQDATTAINILKAVWSYNLLGLATSSFTLTSDYIDKVMELYENAESVEAGWYALMFYYFTKENPRLLKAIVDPDTGSVEFKDGSGIVQYGLNYDENDIIEKTLIYQWQTLWQYGHVYSPSSDYLLGVLSISETAVSIVNADWEEYSKYALEYVLAELGYRTGNMGVSFNVAASVNNSNYGTVSGSGNYIAGKEVTVETIALNNANFLGWENVATGEIVSTSNIYTFKITCNVALQAVFEAPEIIPAVVPTITTHPIGAIYAKGQNAKALIISASASDGGTIGVEWFLATSHTSTGTKVGNGSSYIPSTSSEGVFYYYAKITNEKNGTCAIKYTNRAKVTIESAVITKLVVVTPPAKTSYLVNETFSTEELTVCTIYSDNTQVTILDYVLNYDFSKEGATEVKIGYCGFVAKIDVVVSRSVGGSLVNGIAWEVDGVNKTLTFSGEGKIPSNTSQMLSYYAQYVDSIVITDGITEIDDFGLSGFACVHSLYLPKTLEYIGDSAFANCTIDSMHLEEIASWCRIRFYDIYSNPLILANELYIDHVAVEEIVIPKEVDFISDYAFAYCSFIVAITVECADIGDYAFAGCMSATELNLLEGVENIGKSAFEGCAALVSLSVPNSVAVIEANAFADCEMLEKVNIGNGVVQLGKYVFSGCFALQTFEIPTKIVSVSEGAFLNCFSLNSITVSQGTARFNDYAFSGCSKLKYIYYDGSRSEWKEVSIGEFNDELESSTIVFGEIDSHFEFAEETDVTNIKLLPDASQIRFNYDEITAIAIIDMFVDCEIGVLKSDGDAINNEAFVGTGCIVTSTFKGVTESRTVVVAGDVDGDGIIAATDVICLRMMLTESASYEDAFMEAADRNGDGVRSTADYLEMKRLCKS